ncbi:hypothetical protein [Nocardia salmonicida]|uniref:hypothetical protein n=1 Tax=Nocardia salmonicida TaxID=53431 RepID=UPI002E29DD64|nr:hypothetical protein [Nocardia salmonicida]
MRELAYTASPDSELPYYGCVSLCAVIDIPVGDLEVRLSRSFSRSPAGGAFLLLTMRTGVPLGLFAPPDHSCAYVAVRGYGGGEPQVDILVEATGIPRESVRWLTGYTDTDGPRVVEGRDAHQGPPPPPWLAEVNASISAASDPRLQRDPVTSREEARELFENVFETGREFRVFECTHGWVGRAVLTDDEVAGGAGLGLGNYVLNKRTGAITAHASLPPHLIGEQFDAAIESGERVAGYQVYPPLCRIDLHRTSENARTISYRIDVSRLDRQSDTTTQHVEITKNPIGHQPTDRTSGVVTSWAQMRHNTTGTWPAKGTFDY